MSGHRCGQDRQNNESTHLFRLSAIRGRKGNQVRYLVCLFQPLPGSRVLRPISVHVSYLDVPHTFKIESGKSSSKHDLAASKQTPCFLRETL
jgi:hypothetical protein